jgi:hypothetical protein
MNQTSCDSVFVMMSAISYVTVFSIALFAYVKAQRGP